jgi:aminoglycoside phosphotransferase (APT) family kinase protein
VRRFLATGRDADVFALGDDLVLRRYRDDGADAAAEAVIMRHVAAHGYPVPTVHRAGGTDLVMERLDGPTMMAAVNAGDVDPGRAARMLADLHDRLHRIPALTARAGDSSHVRVIHLDLHPENVMLVARGPVVIDWRNAKDGDPEIDVALSALILAQLAVDDSDARAAAARQMLVVFAASVRDNPGRRLDEALAIRAADANTTPAERDRISHAASLVRSSR